MYNFSLSISVLRTKRIMKQNKDGKSVKQQISPNSKVLHLEVVQSLKKRKRKVQNFFFPITSNPDKDFKKYSSMCLFVSSLNCLNGHNQLMASRLYLKSNRSIRVSVVYSMEAFSTMLSLLDFGEEKYQRYPMLIAPIYLRRMVVETKELCGNIALTDLLWKIIMI